MQAIAYEEVRMSQFLRQLSVDRQLAANLGAWSAKTSDSSSCDKRFDFWSKISSAVMVPFSSFSSPLYRFYIENDHSILRFFLL